MSEKQISCCSKFRGHLRSLQKRTSSNCDGFDIELRFLREIDRRVKSNIDEFYTASKGSSEAKNRFPFVKPNESTMVRLYHSKMGSESSYINANYIDAREIMKVPFVYIAAQAPLQNTVIDFWQMIYQNNVFFIVMLCDTNEAGKEKSAVYWPVLHDVFDFGLFRVRNESENYQNESVYRTLTIESERYPKRSILHMQHTAWPDEGVPQASAPLMKMFQTIGKSKKSLEAPILVHCSGGVGRTGVFIALHIALAQFQLEFEEIYLSNIVRFLKLCRSGMVHRKDQYVFLYYAVQREMERMVLSTKAGVNMLDLLPREEGNIAAVQNQTHSWTRLGNLKVKFPKKTEASGASVRSSSPPIINTSMPRHHPTKSEEHAGRDVHLDMAVMRAYLRRREVLEKGRSNVFSCSDVPPTPLAR